MTLLELAERWAASPRVLVLEDDLGLAQVMEGVFSQCGCEVVIAATVAEAIEAVGAQRFDIAFVDLRLPDGSGVELIRHIKFCAPLTPVVVMTGMTNGEQLEQALAFGVVAFLRKPYDMTTMQLKNTLRLFKIKQRLPELAVA